MCDCYLVMVEGLVSLDELESYAGRRIFFLVRPPLPERLIVRVQMKSSLPILWIMKLGCRLITHSDKNS